MSKNKIKNKPLINNKLCINCFRPTHIKFNFSFISYDENFTEDHQIQLLKRIRELSSVPYLEMTSWPRSNGIEIEKIDIPKEISSNFFKGNSHRNFDDKKYAIFRLYTNNNPIVARVIGRIINQVFYIFFIDIGGTLYKHGR